MSDDNVNQEKLRYGKAMEVEAKMSKLYLDSYGRELPDPTPIAPPVGYTKQPSMVDHVRALVARSLSERAAELGAETFEEANDFEIGDDYEPETPYEVLGREGELGPLPPEVATLTPQQREAMIAERAAAAQAASNQTNPAAGGGGGGGSQNTPPSPPPSTTSQTSPASSPGTAPAGGPGQ